MFPDHPTMSEFDNRIYSTTFRVFGLLLTLVPARALGQEPPPPSPEPALAPTAANATSSVSHDTAELPTAASSHRETAAKEVCGHIGIALPLIMMDHPTKSVGDQVNIAVPIGIGIKLTDKLVFDFETVVATHIKQGNKPTGLTVDPGVVYDLGPFAAGLRVKWDIGAPPNIGVIPLIHRGIVDLGGATWFVEAAFPTTYVTNNVNFDIVLHTGLGF